MARIANRADTGGMDLHGCSGENAMPTVPQRERYEEGSDLMNAMGRPAIANLESAPQILPLRL